MAEPAVQSKDEDEGEEETVPLKGEEETFLQAESVAFGAAELPMGPAEDESAEAFSSDVKAESSSPELDDMEQPKPVTGTGAPSHASSALTQASALLVHAESHEEPGDPIEPISLYSEAAFEEFGQNAREHGSQRWQQEHQQHGAEEIGIGGRREETAEETQLIVLDPEHPLMRRFQAALKSYLTKQMEKMNLDLQELRTATKKGKVQREELGVVLYGVQQQLAQLQMELERSRERHSQTAAVRQQLEEQVEGLRLAHKQARQDTDDERKKVSAMQAQVENLAMRLFHMQNMDEDMRHNILLMKQSTKKAEAEKVRAEVEKKKQDLLVERLTRKAYELQEQVALFEAQIVAQEEDTKMTRQAVNEANTEVQAINMEKKRLINHWNNSLAGMRQRDEAYAAMQELLRYSM